MDTNAILTAFLDPAATLPQVAQRVGVSLAALAQWASANASILANLQHLFETRAKLLARQLELGALDALAKVACEDTPTTDPRLRERVLERRRKAAGAILRHRAFLERPVRRRAAPLLAT